MALGTTLLEIKVGDGPWTVYKTPVDGMFLKDNWVTTLNLKINGTPDGHVQIAMQGNDVSQWGADHSYDGEITIK